jgi:hypothetical protein
LTESTVGSAAFISSGIQSICSSSSALLLTLFTFWPPGPRDLLYLHCKARLGILVDERPFSHVVMRSYRATLEPRTLLIASGNGRKRVNSI